MRSGDPLETLDPVRSRRALWGCCGERIRDGRVGNRRGGRLGAKSERKNKIGIENCSLAIEIGIESGGEHEIPVAVVGKPVKTIVLSTICAHFSKGLVF